MISTNILESIQPEDFFNVSAVSIPESLQPAVAAYREQRPGAGIAESINAIRQQLDDFQREAGIAPLDELHQFRDLVERMRPIPARLRIRVENAIRETTGDRTISASASGTRFLGAVDDAIEALEAAMERTEKRRSTQLDLEAQQAAILARAMEASEDLSVLVELLVSWESSFVASENIQDLKALRSLVFSMIRRLQPAFLTATFVVSFATVKKLDFERTTPTSAFGGFDGDSRVDFNVRLAKPYRPSFAR